MCYKMQLLEKSWCKTMLPVQQHSEVTFSRLSNLYYCDSRLSATKTNGSWHEHSLDEVCVQAGQKVRVCYMCTLQTMCSRHYHASGGTACLMCEAKRLLVQHLLQSRSSSYFVLHDMSAVSTVCCAVLHMTRLLPTTFSSHSNIMCLTKPSSGLTLRVRQGPRAARAPESRAT